MKYHFIVTYHEVPEHKDKYARLPEHNTVNHLVHAVLVENDAQDIKFLFEGSMTFTYTSDEQHLEEVINNLTDKLNHIIGIRYFLAPLMIKDTDESETLSFHQWYLPVVDAKSLHAMSVREDSSRGDLSHYPEYEVVHTTSLNGMEDGARLLQHKEESSRFAICHGDLFQFFRIAPVWHTVTVPQDEADQLKMEVFDKVTKEFEGPDVYDLGV